VEDKEKVELLIDKGADVNTEDKDGMTPLHYAAEEDNESLVKYLVEKGTRISTIQLAASAGDLTKVKQFLEENIDINAKDKGDSAALYWATRAKRDEVAQLLVGREADVNLKGCDGLSPLHYACKHGRKKIVELLLAKDADIDAKEESRRGLTPLHRAALSGHKEIVELLLARGVPVDSRSKMLDTPLLCACEGGNLDAAEMLINKGANIEAKNKSGQTPLHIAVENPTWYNVDDDMIKLLLTRGADINARTHYDATPLHAAIQQGNDITIKQLLASGSDLWRRQFELAPVALAI
jgi:ankyrin repeat protein